ncbi:MAG: hypothetical protein DME32_13745 [Verrucomicrobia bacterium]|nr:MAG: hypothetical protein DME32_13745 [Verrucomicrobiota bacterium]
MSNAQVRCVAERTRLQSLLNSLRELEGLPPLPQAGSTVPRKPTTLQGPGVKMPNPEYNQEAIEKWHKEHDAEVAELRQKLESPDCATLNPPPEPTHPYDLMFDQIDDTGVALAPVWNSTRTPPLFTTPDPSQCGNGKPWQSPCTSQPTEINNNPGLCPTGELGGHANWIAATYMGRLTWESHSLESQDDDYNFNLLPWIPSTALVPWITSTDNQLTGLHIEFSSDETIDHFHTPWWSSFHSAVDDDDSRSIANPFGEPRREMVWGERKALQMVQGNFAIVTGLMGVDCAHSCGAEIHPVWAMAIHVQDDPDDDRWAFFARNWGNEGYCASKLEVLNTQSFTFRLPWRPGATQVDVIGQNFLWRSSDNASGTIDPRPNEQALLVTLNLAAPNEKDRVNGELHLKWQGSPKKSFLARAEATRVGDVQKAIQKIESTKAGGTPAGKTAAEATIATAIGNRQAIEAEAEVAIENAKLTARQKLLLKQKLPSPDLTADSRRGVLQRSSTTKSASSPLVVSVAPDPRGQARSRQRAAALKAARASTP